MKNQEWANYNINDVVAFELCTRCGACGGVCPQDAIAWDSDYFPTVTETEACTGCQLCLAVCGGLEVNFPVLSQLHYGALQNFTHNAIGPIINSVVAHSTNEIVRKKGASGGLASQIVISLLENGEIDGAVVVGFSANDPLKPVAQIAKTREQVLACAQSKYFIFPVAHVYSEIIRSPGRYAVVGLPCQLHSLFRWQQISKKLRERIALKVGLVCHANLDPVVIKDLLKVKRVKKEEIAMFEFRGGRWPGGICVTKKDNSVVPLHKWGIKDGAFNYLNKLYVSDRCLLCIDYSAELSDVSIADPWLRDKRGDYIFRGGWSLAHIKTERGNRVLTMLEQKGDINVQQVDHKLVVRNARAMTYHKKRGAFIRLKKKAQNGMPVPDYHISPPSLTLHDHFREHIYQITLIGKKIRLLRKPLLRLAFSRYGDLFSQFKMKIKKWKYRFLSG